MEWGIEGVMFELFRLVVTLLSLLLFLAGPWTYIV